MFMENGVATVRMCSLGRSFNSSMLTAIYFKLAIQYACTVYIQVYTVATVQELHSVAWELIDSDW